MRTPINDIVEYTYSWQNLQKSAGKSQPTSTDYTVHQWWRCGNT